MPSSTTPTYASPSSTGACGVGGHWLEAYPFVRLHQSSTFYGAASTVLGGRIQQDGPEAGLHERADQPTICAYYDDLLADRMVGSGRVEFFPGHDYLGDRTFVSLDSGERLEVPERCRIVDARYLAPEIPAETPPRFAVDGAQVIPVNDLVRIEHDPGQYVIVGSGKTATDACIWLLRERGVDPDDICWVRPRDPWMLNRALIQPDPAIYLGMVADMMGVSAGAASLDDLFLGLEDAGIMLRIDRSVVPTMAKAPTLGPVGARAVAQHRERRTPRAHPLGMRPGRLDLADGSVALADDALIVNCAADGLKNPGRVPIWQPDAITLQTIRAGFPCFGAALAGYVEATRDDDAEKNRLCPPSSYGNSLQDWATMNVTRPAQLGVVRLRARHQGLDRQHRGEPRPHPPGLRHLTGARRRPRTAADPPAFRAGPARRVERSTARLDWQDQRSKEQ